jgi:hypothetical protein
MNPDTGSLQSSPHNSQTHTPGRATMAHMFAAKKGDEPFFDPVAYGNGPDDSVTDTNETAAITHHTIEIGGRQINYTATAGHLVTVDESSSQPNAKMFYVAFTEDGQTEESRPVTFFYNGGPGSSSVFVLLGSFAPKRIKTSMPSFTPPAPYQLEDNPDSLLDKSDLVFINPVGTGYSAAVAPHRNRDFWGVDQDARSIKQFIKRFLTKNNRWNSPKYLFGESYGTARSCVLAYLLHFSRRSSITLRPVIRSGHCRRPQRTRGITRSLASRRRRPISMPSSKKLRSLLGPIIWPRCANFRRPTMQRSRSSRNTRASTRRRCSPGASTSPVTTAAAIRCFSRRC